MSGWSAAELAEERARAETMQLKEDRRPGPRYAGPASVTKEFIDSLVAFQADGGLLPKADVYLMVLDVIDLLRKESTVQPVSLADDQEMTVVGDIHGQYWDFMHLLELAGMPSKKTPFLFNGDFVDRGSWSVEVMTVLLSMKLKDPTSVFLNRGNHETLETNILYGFCGEVASKYDLGLFDLFSEVFRNLPLCHLVNKRVLVLHGGLPGPDPRVWMPGQTHDPTDALPIGALPTLDRLSKVDRYQEITPGAYQESIGPSVEDSGVNDLRILIDMLWGDPRGGNGYGPSYRKGKGVYMFGPDVTDAFCERNGLQCVVRSHEVKSEGYRWDHPRLLSVFSAPNYLDTGKNKGAYLKVKKNAGGDDLEVTAENFEARPHPDLPPMHWQGHIRREHPHLTRTMRKVQTGPADEFGDSEFAGLMNIDEWEEDEADHFQQSFKHDAYGREAKTDPALGEVEASA